MQPTFSMRRFTLPGIHEPIRIDKVLDVWRRDSDIRQLVDGEICAEGDSEAPDNSGGGVVVLLIGTGVVTVQVVALQPPGKILEGKLVVEAAAYVDGDGVVDEAVRVDMPNAGHGVHERTPLSVTKRKPGSADEYVLLHRRAAAAIVTAAIGDQTEARKASEGKRLEGPLKAAITLFVDDVGRLAVRNSGVDVAIGKQSVKLCRHRN